MKIIGKGKDYYDSALRHGRSTGLCFFRTSSTFFESSRDDADFTEHAFMFDGVPSNNSVRRAKYGKLLLSPFRVAFCGKLYNGIKAQFWGPELLCEWDGPSKVEYLYEPEGLACLIAETGLAQVDKPQKWETDAVPGLLAFLESPAPVRHGFFVGKGEAIVLAENGQGYHARQVTVNPTLAEVAFFKVMDPWQAFQELEMFLGGIAAPENGPPVVIADKDRVMQHGFDKMSFRKQPTKVRR